MMLKIASRPSIVRNDARGKGGQAVVIVVVFLAMFFIIGLAFFMLSQTERLGAITHINTIRSRYVAEAGVEYAKKVLQLDKRTSAVDSFRDISFTQFQGADADTDGDGTPDARWINVADAQGNAFGRFAVRVSDEAGKLNVNYSTNEQLETLLRQRNLDSALAEKIIARRPFDAVEEIGSLIDKESFKTLRDFITVYSRDDEVDASGARRVYLNSANRQLIIDTLTSRAIADPRVKAAMLIDAADTDVSQTVLTEFTVNNLFPSTLDTPGDWKQRDGYYEAPLNGQAGTFTWSNLALDNGNYACYVYGAMPDDIVGVVDGQYLRSGDKLQHDIAVSGGVFSLTIGSAANAPSRFAHVQLTRDVPGGGLHKKVIPGAEAVVINELMVNLKAVFGVGGGDIPPGGVMHYDIETGLRPGWYHLQFFSGASGGYVGDVSCGGSGASGLYSGDYISSGVEIGSDGRISVNVRNTDPFKHASVSRVVVSQEPDCEYIELVNLCGQTVDIGNFFVEVYTPSDELVKGWPARIPANTVMQPYQYLVLAMDDNDGGLSPAKLAGNGVSFRRRWGFNGAQPDFEDYQNRIDRNFDLLPNGGAKVMLKNARGARVDAVEYQAFQVRPFVSIERSDPSARIDSDMDGLLDGWYASTAAGGATPGNTNENLGMYTKENNDIIRHTPAQVRIFNRPLINLSEALELSSGVEWQTFSRAEIALMCDVFAYDALVFAWPQSGDEIGLDSIPAGAYWLTIEGVDCEGSILGVSVAAGGGDFNAPSSLIFTGDRAHYGNVLVPGRKDGALRVRVTDNSQKHIVIKNVILEPVRSVYGRINVNTASPEVLRTIFAAEEAVQKIIKARPLGDNGGQRLGVGDAILLDDAILQRHKQLTVKSDVYEVQSSGQYLLHGKAPASVNIRIILERGT